MNVSTFHPRCGAPPERRLALTPSVGNHYVIAPIEAPLKSGILSAAPGLVSRKLVYETNGEKEHHPEHNQNSPEFYIATLTHLFLHHRFSQRGEDLDSFVVVHNFRRPPEGGPLAWFYCACLAFRAAKNLPPCMHHAGKIWNQ
jgi:hypothetical protein